SFKNFAFHFHLNPARQVSATALRRHLRDVAYLVREIACHRVYVIREILPRPGDTRHVSLSAEAPFRAYLASHTSHFCCKGAQLLDHGVEGLFELQDLSAHIYGDLLRQVTGCNGRGDFCDVADLSCQVIGHEVDIVREVLPGTGHTGNLRLTT